MIALSFVTFALGVAVGFFAAIRIHFNSHPDCPANRGDDGDGGGDRSEGSE